MFQTFYLWNLCLKNSKKQLIETVFRSIAELKVFEEINGQAGAIKPP